MDQRAELVKLNNRLAKCERENEDLRRKLAKLKEQLHLRADWLKALLVDL